MSILSKWEEAAFGTNQITILGRKIDRQRQTNIIIEILVK